MESEHKLDMCTLKTITKTIKEVTHSGCKELEGTKYRYVIDCCKINDGYVEHSFTKLMFALKEKHSEVRYSTVLLFDVLFHKFDRFRTLLLNSFSDFISFTFPFKEDLPLPKAAAVKLLTLTIKTIDNWYQIFGRQHPKLMEEYDNLKNRKHVDFEKLEIFDPIKRKKETEELQKSLALNKELLNKATNDVYDMENEIKNCLTSLDSCFNLLVPFHLESNVDDYDLRSNGTSFSIQIEQRKIKVVQSEENEVILESMRESISLINKRFLPKVRAWKVLIEKGQGGDSLMEKALEYCYKLEQMIHKYESFEVVKMDPEDEVSTDSELEEVEEKCEVKPAPVKMEEELTFFEKLQKNKIKMKDVVKDPDEENSSVSKSVTAGPLTDRKKDLLEKAPVVRYDVDLYSWGEDKTTETLLPSSTDGHRFWAAPEIDQVEVPLEMRRVIEFTGEFEEVKHVCRAKLPSGKLCPRQDRVKCPFHGTIIPRDEEGNPLDGGEGSSTRKETVPDWQDAALLARLKAETGIDLTIGKKRKGKPSPLTSLKKTPTARDKISKKVFDKKSMKRVAKTLDRLDYRRHRDKFGDQFNYSNAND